MFLPNCKTYVKPYCCKNRPIIQREFYIHHKYIVQYAGDFYVGYVFLLSFTLSPFIIIVHCHCEIINLITQYYLVFFFLKLIVYYNTLDFIIFYFLLRFKFYKLSFNHKFVLNECLEKFMQLNSIIYFFCDSNSINHKKKSKCQNKNST